MQSAAITLLLLIIIVPLLASANPFFNTLVGDFFKLLNIEHILRTLFGDLFGLYVMRFLLFLILFTLIPRLLAFANKEALHLETAFERVITFNHLLMPKMVITIVLAIFFVTQAQLYFATDTILTAIGYSNSRYAREVFGQLTVVTAIIFALIYIEVLMSKPTLTNTNVKFTAAAWKLITSIESLKKKYAKLPWQAFNLSQQKEYEAIKKVPIEQYKTTLNNISWPSQYIIPTPRN